MNKVKGIWSGRYMTLLVSLVALFCLLLQCSAWWRCRTSTRWIRKAWDTSNPFVDVFWIVAALEASKLLSDLASVCVFQDDLTKPTSRVPKVQRVPKRLVSSRLWWKAVSWLKCVFNWATMKLFSEHTITDDGALLMWQNRCPMCFEYSSDNCRTYFSKLLSN